MTENSLPQRRSIRLPGFDYASDGAYFITICTFDHSFLFGEIIGAEMSLNSTGRLVQEEWLALPRHRPSVTLDEYMVMPNHFHGIFWIQEAGTARRAPTEEKFGRPMAGSLASIVRAFKAATPRRYREASRAPSHRLWQRGYYEPVIRSDDDLYRIQEYILTHPAKWAEDKENPANLL